MSVASANTLSTRIVGAGSFVQRLRLASGLVLMVFATFHFLNHALGNISIEAMEEMRVWRVFIWQSLPGSILLYGALATHVVLTMWKFVSRGTLRLKAWEWLQIAFGLAIPYWLTTHVIAMRGTLQNFGMEVDYPLSLAMLWPGGALSQSLLLIAVWVHGCIGLHFWLRIKPWYKKWNSALAGLATLIPALSITGWITAARENAEVLQLIREQDPESFKEIGDTITDIFVVLSPIIEAGRYVIMGLAVALAAGVTIGVIIRKSSKKVEVRYGDERKISANVGSSILDVSRENGIAHMSVCGGRARCSTCRTLIIEGAENIAPPNEAEQKLLSRLGSDSTVRLACQARIHGNVNLRPLIQPGGNDIALESTDPIGWGIEREIVVMFLDIRGFSKISEQSLPYDIIFILNSFFGEVAKAVESQKGYVDKFMGDGMMALFGLEESPKLAARNAVAAAIKCVNTAESVSQMLTQHLSTPIKIGVGLHMGEAVVGRIGRTGDQTSPSRLTAIGDSVNVAARLEQSTKELKSVLVISSAVAEACALSDTNSGANASTIKVHNISRPVEILAYSDVKELASTMGRKK